MKKLNLGIIGILLAVTLALIPSASAANAQWYSGAGMPGNNNTLRVTEDYINITWLNSTTPEQITTNPKPGDDIWYRTNVTVQTNGSTDPAWVTNLTFVVPDNGTNITNTTIFLCNFTTGGKCSGTYIISPNYTVAGDYFFSVYFDGANFTNISNISMFNLTYKLDGFSTTDRGYSKSGSSVTDTWNVTYVKATTLNITNASITVSPDLWECCKIPSKTVSISFAGATSFANNTSTSAITVWTGDYLNQTGSIVQSLAIGYSIPTESPSGGSSPTGITTITPPVTTAGQQFFLLVIIIIIIVVVTVILAIIIMTKGSKPWY